jgi:putative hydrolase of the HAD superfamily
MNRAMTQYIMDKLEMDETTAYKLRQHYWRVYGATMKGLMRHHGVDPAHFLLSTHDTLDLPTMVIQNKGLQASILRLPGRKVIFTNAPRKYALAVLNLLGIAHLFETIFSVESTRYHPKPSIRGFKQLLKKIKANAADCVMLEDNAQALMTAKRMGMRTIYITKKLHKPIYVDARIGNVLALSRLKIQRLKK